MYTTRFLAMSRRAVTLLSALALAVLLGNAGCGQAVAVLKVGHVQELRTIQSEFNQAATLENQERLAQSPSAAITTSAQVSTSYQSVLASLNQLLKSSQAQLKEDNLLGTVYVLKALTEWRLSEHNAAIETVEKLEAQGVELQPRDKAIVKSFRGLVMNDQAYDHMQAKSAKYADIRTLLQKSIKSFQEGIATLPKNHGMRMYLVIAQLGAIKNWVDLTGEPKRFSSDGELDLTAESGAICTAFKPILATYKSEIELAKTRDAEAGARLEAQWNKALQIETISGACP